MSDGKFVRSPELVQERTAVRDSIIGATDYLRANPLKVPEELERCTELGDKVQDLFKAEFPAPTVECLRVMLGALLPMVATCHNFLVAYGEVPFNDSLDS